MPKSSMSAGGRYIHGKSWEHVQFVQKQLFLKSGHVSSVWFLNISMSKIYLNNLSYLKAQNLNILEMIWFQEPTVQSLRPQPEPQTLQEQWSYSCGCPKPCPQCIGRQQFWPISHQASSCHLTSISLISLISLISVDCHGILIDLIATSHSRRGISQGSSWASTSPNSEWLRSLIQTHQRTAQGLI